jgi:hypothetical protein
MQNNIVKPLDDFFSSKVMLISFISAILASLLVGFLLYILMGSMDSIYGLLPSTVNSYLKVVNDFLKQYIILSFLLEHKFFMWLIHALGYFGIGVVFYYLFFIGYSFIVGVFNAFFMGYLQKRYYQDVELKGMDTISTILFYVKTFIITVIIFVILSPLYIVPVFNIAIFIPIYYFFHKTIIYDASSVINTSKEYRDIKRANKAELKIKTTFCFFITFVPIVGILFYPYYLFVVGHFIFGETRELRYVENFKKLK